MSCKGQEMPTLGILGMTAHKIGKLAQTMYAEYDLNKSQSMIYFSFTEMEEYHRKNWHRS